MMESPTVLIKNPTPIPAIQTPHGDNVSTPETVSLCGVPFTNFREADCVEFVLDSLDADRGGWILTPNLDILRMLATQPEIRTLVKGVDLFVADGMPLLWASRLRGTPLPERVCGSNLIYSLSEGAAKRGRSVFLLGGDAGTAEDAATILLAKYPDLTIAGCWCPPMGFEDNDVEMEKIRTALRDSRPDIIMVALGCPKQERLIDRMRPLLSRAWWIGIGISFSYVSGDVKRAPRWLQAIGLEWIYRLAQDPGRLFTRYIVHDIPFAFRMFGAAFRERLSR